eukprot:712988-Prymnesium_polylepis.1
MISRFCMWVLYAPSFPLPADAASASPFDVHDCTPKDMASDSGTGCRLRSLESSPQPLGLSHPFALLHT